MGFNKDRGDSLNVANANFTIPVKEVITEEPFWKPYANVETAKNAGQYLISIIAVLYLFFKFLKPMLKRVMEPPVQALISETPDLVDNKTPAPPPKPKTKGESIDDAKELAIENPRLVANVVKNWVNE
jgi:flagellar M-ring protein FliF